MRVIAGSAKGRHLLPVPGETTRPITDRVKEALFSILGGDIEDATFLDLFAGTGAVGIEALSRGAAHAVFVDRIRKAVNVIRKNLEVTQLREYAEVVQSDSFRYLRRTEHSFDYIYVAPPQYEDLWAKALLALDEEPRSAEEGQVIVQIYPKEYHPLPLRTLTLEEERHYGSTALYFYRYTPPPAGGREEGDHAG